MRVECGLKYMHNILNRPNDIGIALSVIMHDYLTFYRYANANVTIRDSMKLLERSNLHTCTLQR